MKRKMITTAGVLGLLVLSSAAQAANFHVRIGATGSGNGSDWTNAWSNMSAINYAALKPGDTVYIAAGTYDALAIIKSGAAGNPLTFKRATNAEHGSATGWNSSYDGQVIVDGGGGLAAIGIGEGGSFTGQSYITIDGATKYGIHVRNAMYGIRADRGDCNGCVFRYLELGDTGAGKLGEDGIQGSGNDFLVEYCYIHDDDNGDTHGDGIQWFSGNNVTFRYNLMKNNGQIFMLTETAWGSDYVNNLNVYYNVFYNRGGGHYNGIAKKLCPQAGNSWRIYNNTFDLEAPASGWEDELFSGDGSCTRMVFMNNAVIHSRSYSLNYVTHSYNAFDNQSPYLVIDFPKGETGSVVAADLGFVNVEAADYHLKSTSPLIGKGSNVGLTQDFEGKPVPANPSIGAFEPGTGVDPAPSPSPTMTPSPSPTVSPRPSPTPTPTPTPSPSPKVTPKPSPSPSPTNGQVNQAPVVNAGMDIRVVVTTQLKEVN